MAVRLDLAYGGVDHKEIVAGHLLRYIRALWLNLAACEGGPATGTVMGSMIA